MKKTLFLILFFCSYFTLSAQNSLLLGIEGTAKYASRQSTLVADNYEGKFGFELGVSASQRIRNSRFFWHSGLFYHQFREQNKTNNPPEIINNRQFNNKNEVFTKEAIQIPLGLKIYFSDRKCMMFVQPQLVFDYFFQEKENVRYWTNVEGSEDINLTNQRFILNQAEYTLSAGLAIGGKQPITEQLYLMIQLEGRYGLLGTEDFAVTQPWSMGIRASVLYELF